MPLELLATVSETFLTSAQTAFAFLVNDHGFEIAETIVPQDDRSAVSFYKITYRKAIAKSEPLWVSLATCPVRLELYFELGSGQFPTHERTIGISELLAIEAPEFRLESSAKVYSDFGNVEKMTEQYTAFATALRRYGARFFAGDQSLWSDVRECRRKCFEQRLVRERSHDAELTFKQEDWPRAIELLESLGDNRTELQTARLAYARKRGGLKVNRSIPIVMSDGRCAIEE